MKIPKYIEKHDSSGLLLSRTENYVNENEIRIRFCPELRGLDFVARAMGDRASDIQQIFSQFGGIDFQKAMVEEYVMEVEAKLERAICFLKTRSFLKYDDWTVTYEWD